MTKMLMLLSLKRVSIFGKFEHLRHAELDHHPTAALSLHNWSEYREPEIRSAGRSSGAPQKDRTYVCHH